MRGPRDPDDKATTPFPTAPVSNGEWVPHAITRRQRVVEKLIAEQADRQARRHAMSRSQFLKTAAGTMLGFSVLNRVHGLDAWGDNAVLPVRKVECEDLDAARERLETKPYFIVDVQSHHVDTKHPLFSDPLFCFLPAVISASISGIEIGFPSSDVSSVASFAVPLIPMFGFAPVPADLAEATVPETPTDSKKMILMCFHLSTIVLLSHV
jgi:hypothetical protein